MFFVIKMMAREQMDSLMPSSADTRIKEVQMNPERKPLHTKLSSSGISSSVERSLNNFKFDIVISYFCKTVGQRVMCLKAFFLSFNTYKCEKTKVDLLLLVI